MICWTYDEQNRASKIKTAACLAFNLLNERAMWLKTDNIMNRRWLAVFLLFYFTAFTQYVQAQGAAVPVVATEVKQEDFHLYLTGLGVIKPLNTVKVTSRVNGQLLKVNFKEGQMVKKGDLLALIDPKPLEVKLKLAQGKLERDRALLEKARFDLKRYQKLLAQDSVSPQIVNEKETQLHEYESAVKAGEAGVMDAKLQLSYTRILAPISGRLGFRQIDPGNMIVTSDEQGLVTITQVDPISVVFSIPEDELPRVVTRFRTKEKIRVLVFDKSFKHQLAEGILTAIDNQIDVTTGTVKLKAKLNNPDGMLFANQFVNVKMIVETRPDTLLIPTSAIQRGAQGNYVYRIDKDNIAHVTPIETGPEQGQMTVVNQGLTAGDQIVLEGIDRLRDGLQVKLIQREPEDTETQRATAPGPDA